MRITYKIADIVGEGVGYLVMLSIIFYISHKVIQFLIELREEKIGE